MKTIKSALLGMKTLTDTDDKIILFKVTEILKDHRELIIDRLLRDIPTYLDYKFNIRPGKDQLASVKEMLLKLKKSDIDMNYYKAIFLQVFSNTNTHLTNEPFYVEIDEYLQPFVIVVDLKHERTEVA
jgi:hypothetical protein